jgi:F0F1-type ATP synthase membrane subunit b/b'
MYVKRLSGEPREASVEKPLEAVEEKVEEMESEIETAEEVEERGFEEQAEELEAELESAKNYLLNELLQIYGSIHRNKLDKLLVQKGYKVTSEDLLKAFGSELTISKHGYIQKRER